MKKALLGAVAAIALASPAYAGEKDWYVGLEAGGSWVADDGIAKHSHTDVVGEYFFCGKSHDFAYDYDRDRSYDASYDPGFAGFATFGRRLGSFRLELEGGYRYNELSLAKQYSKKPPVLEAAPAKQLEVVSDSVVIPIGYGHPPIDGDLTEWTLMGNVLYDIRLGSRLKLSLGAGAGFDQATARFGHHEDTDTVFAYQGIGGLTYAISDAWDLMLNYRYLVADDASFYAQDVETKEWGNEHRGGNKTETTTTRYDADFAKHAVTLGLRFKWGEQPVAPTPVAFVAPPAPPGPPRSFIVFFSFDKCTITPESDKVLAQAADAAETAKSVAISIVGHTDSMGTVPYNQALSNCRASATKKNLVSKGIAADAIVTSGKGETELLIKTGDQVDEPQNRRATIDLN